LLSEGQWRVHLSLLPDEVERTVMTSIWALPSYKKEKKTFFPVAIQGVVRLSNIETNKIQNLSLTAVL